MMKFQYVGDEHAPAVTTVYGREFQRNGAPVEVSDAFAIKKLKGNISFVAIEEAAPAAEAAEGDDLVETQTAEQAPGEAAEAVQKPAGKKADKKPAGKKAA